MMKALRNEDLESDFYPYEGISTRRQLDEIKKMKKVYGDAVIDYYPIKYEHEGNYTEE